MSRTRTVLLSGMLLLAAMGCGEVDAPSADAEPDVRRAGGDTTVENVTANAFALPAPNLGAERTDRHHVGNSLFNRNWVAAPASPQARDGLGPLFNARSCSACHFKDGRGRNPEAGEQPVALLFKLGRRDAEGVESATPHPAWGSQLQNHALPGIDPEALVEVSWEEAPGTYADGKPYVLRRPVYTLDSPAWGEPGDDLVLAPRIAPQVFGLGLLETVPEATILALADPEDRDGDGISGRPNRVPDLRSGGTSLGRFGWKAGQPTVEQQSAAALRGDMGITTPLFPEVEHTAAQRALDDLPHGGDPEVDERLLDFIVFYGKTLAVPARRAPEDAEVLRGELLFRAARCDACHVPRLETGEDPEFPELSNQVFFPYTDLLLHDLGEELSDRRPEAEATGREWRTPPLWGIGLFRTVNGHQELLHDGRARGVAEAILWHGGEAEASREAFRAMSQAERAALVRFVEDL